jgi:hypothetical protein
VSNENNDNKQPAAVQKAKSMDNNQQRMNNNNNKQQIASIQQKNVVDDTRTLMPPPQQTANHIQQHTTHPISLTHNGNDAKSGVVKSEIGDRKTPYRQTVTKKTRKFEIDGKMMTTTTTHLLNDDGEFQKRHLLATRFVLFLVLQIYIVFLVCLSLFERLQLLHLTNSTNLFFITLFTSISKPIAHIATMIIYHRVMWYLVKIHLCCNQVCPI